MNTGPNQQRFYIWSAPSEGTVCFANVGTAANLQYLSTEGCRDVGIKQVAALESGKCVGC